MLRENKYNILANLIIVMLMSSSICQALYTSLFMTTNLSFKIFLMVIPFTLLFFIMFRSKLTTIISIIAICLVSIMVSLYIIFIVGVINTGNWLNQYYNWFIDVFNGFADGSSSLNINIILVLISFIVTLLVFIFSIKLNNFYVLTIMLFSVFFVQLKLNIFVSKASFILFLFSFMLYYFFNILKKRTKESSYKVGNKLMYLVCILPVCLLVIAFSFSLPINNKRIEIPWLDSKFDYLIDYFSDNERSDFDYFSFKATGFGNDGRLGGNLNQSKTHVLNVKSESSKLYLKASAKSIYNGRSWYNNDAKLVQLGVSKDIYSVQINQDTNEFTDGVFIQTGALKNDKIFKPTKAEVEFVNMKTKSIFLPLKINNLKFYGYQTLFNDHEQIISLNSKQHKPFSYDIDYNNMILNGDELKAILRKSYKGYYTDLFYNYFYNYTYNKSGNTVLYLTSLVKAPDNQLTDSDLRYDKILTSYQIEQLLTKAGDAYKRYTQLPNDLPSRVKQLAVNITKDYKNNYDKAKAIETYLSSKYTYTLKPGNIPRNRDFVDYFLFDGKKGYCTYYASSMAILLRCIGIPSRYVEGYVLPPTADKGVYKVTNEQAHAWVEVYFEGFGWIPFEPTSSFVSKMYYDTTITSQSYDDMKDSGYNSYLEYLEKMEKYKNKSNTSYDSDEIEPVPVESNTSNVFVILMALAIFIGLILLAFIILILKNTIKSYFTIRKIRKAEPNSSILIAYNYILKILKTQNIEYKPAETPTQFGIKVEKTFDFKGYSFNKTNFMKITNYYIKARYSKASLSQNDKQDILYFIEILLNATFDRMGRMKFILTKYILGRL